MVQSQRRWASVTFLRGVNWLSMLRPSHNSRPEMPPNTAKAVGSDPRAWVQILDPPFTKISWDGSCFCASVSLSVKK